MADTPSKIQPLYTPVPQGIGTDAAVRQAQREYLPGDYPKDLARSSEPANGSIGDGSMPIKNREAPWKRLGGK